MLLEVLMKMLTMTTSEGGWGWGWSTLEAIPAVFPIQTPSGGSLLGLYFLFSSSAFVCVEDGQERAYIVVFMSKQVH
jgi:hypothetical protein